MTRNDLPSSSALEQSEFGSPDYESVDESHDPTSPAVRDWFSDATERAPGEAVDPTPSGRAPEGESSPGDLPGNT
jgi:hypothetical protein